MILHDKTGDTFKHAGPADSEDAAAREAERVAREAGWRLADGFEWEVNRLDNRQFHVSGRVVRIETD